MLAASAALLLAVALASRAVAQPLDSAPRITIAFVEGWVDGDDLAGIEGVSPGLLSAGLGAVAPAQIYLDITQGNRILSSLYPDPLPLAYTLQRGVPARLWTAVVERAREAPADLVPGLLASAIADAGAPGVAARSAPLTGASALVGVDRDGRLIESERCARAGCAGVTVTTVSPSEVPSLVERLRGDDLLIAIARPLPLGERRTLAIGIAGSGFAGNLTSDSTRLDGFVLSTDIGPTVLERLGIPVPDAMTGTPIRAEGSVDVARVAALAARLDEIGPRRDGVILGNFVIWVLLAGIVSIGLGRRGARVALPLLLIASAYVPALLLLGAALDPTELAERLLVGVGAPLLAAITLSMTRPYAAIAAACALSVGAHAVDVVVGSPLTAQSLLGPNPSLGARFFGIGNELEATLAALLLLGIGAALAARRGPVTPGFAATGFALGAILGVLVFAPGQFGADVGMAIALPFGAAVAIAVVLRAGLRVAVLIVAAPVAALAIVVIVDLFLGGDAHLSQSVLQAGGLDQLGDVAQRRITLSARSFERSVDSPYFLVAIGLIALALVRRADVLAWFRDRRAALAGLLGAAAATVLGTLANDSGALLLMVGTAYVAMFAGVAWATAAPGKGPADGARVHGS
jgi:hypothetical protein